MWRSLGNSSEKNKKEKLKERPHLIFFRPMLYFSVPRFLRVSFIGQLLHCLTSSGTSYILDFFLFAYVKRVVNFYSIEKARKFIKSHSLCTAFITYQFCILMNIISLGLSQAGAGQIMPTTVLRTPPLIFWPCDGPGLQYTFE